MENTRRRIDVRLVSCPRRMRKLINRPTFKQCTTYREDLAAVTLNKTNVKFDKPIYVGFAVLDISKTLMYRYHYDVMRAHYKDNITLMYTDTDSLIYRVMTDDFYEDLQNSPDLFGFMDTANLPPNHPCYLAERKKVPGFFSDECDGRTMLEFVALRAKSYAYHIDHEKKEKRFNIKAKGVRKHVVDNHLSLEDHKRCLFDDADSDDDEETNILLAENNARRVANAIRQNITPSTILPYTPYRVNVSFRSFKHEIKTIKTTKLALKRFDDKRVILNDRINTLAHGHYKLL